MEAYLAVWAKGRDAQIIGEGISMAARQAGIDVEMRQGEDELFVYFGSMGDATRFLAWVTETSHGDSKISAVCFFLRSRQWRNLRKVPAKGRIGGFFQKLGF
jgi:hypothetical protein